MIQGQIILPIVMLLILITCSAMASGSEVAFFSITPAQERDLEEEQSEVSKRILELKLKPKKLLATILISNNFVNIAIVIVTQMVINALLPYGTLLSFGQVISDSISNYVSANALASGLNFFLTVVLVTFILVLFGEVAPKIYANIDNIKFARMMSGPISVLNFFFTPLSSILVGWGNGLESRITASRNYQTGMSKEDLDAAIELTVKNETDSQQDIDILKGIIKFGDLSAKQIMKPRIDVVGIEIEMDYAQVLQIVRDSGYSRLPVYEVDFDHIVGILYVKDLLEFINEPETYHWQSLIRRNVMFVPESKKIDDLLREFQSKRMHMSLVVNEFGGSEGIITLEDIMEEVIGDIKDEFDEEEEVDYIILGKDNYIFEGKTLLHDVARVIGENLSYFDDVKGNADSLGGLIIEHIGDIPKEEKEILIKEAKLKIITVTNRRIGKVNLKINRQ